MRDTFTYHESWAHHMAGMAGLQLSIACPIPGHSHSHGRQSLTHFKSCFYTVKGGSGAQKGNLMKPTLEAASITWRKEDQVHRGNLMKPTLEAASHSPHVQAS
eukprot:1158974-Pelagomonas_calceolata.AAC.5